MRRILFFLLFPLPLAAQFTYTIDQSVPVVVEGKTLTNPWAGGLNSAQMNTLDLNADGKDDLVIFDNTTAKINTYVVVNNTYVYAPEYEIYFPTEISTFVVLRDYDCDGKKDLFTFGQIGILVFKNITPPGGHLSWKKLKFFNSGTGLYSDVLLTLGVSGKINLLPGVNDLPNFTDMDGDGDLDVLNMRFVSPSSAEYHKNFSMERYGRCDSLELERQTDTWGNFEECSCGKIAFGSQTCADIGGRVAHTGGKSLLTFDADNDGDKDLVYAEESCTNLYFMENKGNAAIANMTSFSIFPPGTPVNILYPASFLADWDFDGKPDLIASSNLYARNALTNNFRQSVWFYKNTGTSQVPVFTFSKNNFLQENMIEVGDFSAPAFTDMDQDGDEDMIIGRYTAEAGLGTFYYFENTGTTLAPSFQFVTDDIFNFSLLPYYNLKPQFIDFDNNGGMDLIFTATNSLNGKTSLYYMLSKSSTAPSFAGQPIQLVSSILLDASENATMIDIDQDGKKDLLIGRYNGALEYWRNSGGGSFFLSNNKYLGLGTSLSRQSVTAVAGDLDADGREDLVVGDQRGIISVYNDFRQAGANALPLSNLIYDSFTKTYTSKNLGGRLRPVIVNLFGTDKPGIITGNTQGGLYLLKNDNGQVLSEKPNVLILTIVAGDKMEKVELA
ncbi:MAG TPA: VCBS repeat-containing protein [Cyclobacteriaceae bacterium]|nr:VCBS repeat-containing protein [Cyclobacteriaceae bacterium]